MTSVPHARQVNPGIQTLALSATCGDGMAQWYDWIAAQRVAIGAVEAPAMSTRMGAD